MRRLRCLFTLQPVVARVSLRGGIRSDLRVLRAAAARPRSSVHICSPQICNTATGWRRHDAAVSVAAEIPDRCMPNGWGRRDRAATARHGRCGYLRHSARPVAGRAVACRDRGRVPRADSTRVRHDAQWCRRAGRPSSGGQRRAYLEQHLPPVRLRTCRAVAGHLLVWDSAREHTHHDTPHCRPPGPVSRLPRPGHSLTRLNQETTICVTHAPAPSPSTVLCAVRAVRFQSRR